MQAKGAILLYFLPLGLNYIRNGYRNVEATALVRKGSLTLLTSFRIVFDENIANFTNCLNKV